MSKQKEHPQNDPSHPDSRSRHILSLSAPMAAFGKGFSSTSDEGTVESCMVGTSGKESGKLEDTMDKLNVATDLETHDREPSAAMPAGLAQGGPGEFSRFRHSWSSTSFSTRRSHGPSGPRPGPAGYGFEPRQSARVPEFRPAFILFALYETVYKHNPAYHSRGRLAEPTLSRAVPQPTPFL